MPLFPALSPYDEASPHDVSEMRFGRLMRKVYEEKTFSSNVATLAYTTVLSVLPLLMMWLYFTWTIGLDGRETEGLVHGTRPKAFEICPSLRP